MRPIVWITFLLLVMTAVLVSGCSGLPFGSSTPSVEEETTVSENPDVQELRTQSLEGVPKLFLEDFSGCGLQLDSERVTKFLLDLGFVQELKVYVIPAAVPVQISDGTVLAAGTFTPTDYGARITLDTTYLGTETFSENVDHEFGHLVQWLTKAPGDGEDFAVSYAEDNDLDFVLTDVPTLQATEEGTSHGPFLYRREAGPTLFVYDEANPEPVSVILSGFVRKTETWEPEGWHVVPNEEFYFGLATYNGYCAFLG